MAKRSDSYVEKTILEVPYIVKKEKNGYVVECIDLNIVSQGNNLQEARKNIREAILLHFNSASELGILDNELEKLGITKKKNKLEVIPRDLESTPIEIPFASS